MSESLDLPSKEAIEYGRRVLQTEVARLRRFENQALNRGNMEQSNQWGSWANWLEFRVLGDGEGCIITPFDPRYLDDPFRVWLTYITEPDIGQRIATQEHPPND